ncbi:MAG: hypothetical protein JNL90_04530 [Planctomycetes bacterium]|nr:hypothetical protein [Planctomycetota bacterium]
MSPLRHQRSLAFAALALVAVAAALAGWFPIGAASRGSGDSPPSPELASRRAQGRAPALPDPCPPAGIDLAMRRTSDDTAKVHEDADSRQRAPAGSESPLELPADEPLPRVERRGALAGRLLLDPTIPPASLGVLVRDALAPQAPPEFVALAPDGGFACAELPAGSYTLEAVLHDDWFGADWDAEAEPSALALALGAATVEPELIAAVEPLDLRGRLHLLRLHVRRDRGASAPARCFYGPPDGAPASRSLAWIGADDEGAALVTPTLPIDVCIVARELQPVQLDRIATDVTITLESATERPAEPTRGSGD